MPVSTGVDVDAVYRIGTSGFSSIKGRLADAAGWLAASTSRVRSGITPGSGGVVSVTGAVGSEQWNITPFRFVLDDGAGGNYKVVVANTKSESYPTRPGSGTSRYDALVLEPLDTGASSGRYFRIRLYSGTAAASPNLSDTLALIPAGDYVLATLLATNGSAPVVSQALPRTVAVGGVLPVATLAELNAITNLWDGLRVYQEDADLSFRRVNGAWRGDGDLLASNSNDNGAVSTNNGAWGTLSAAMAMTVTFNAPAGGQVEVYTEAFLGGQAQQAAYGLRLSGGTTRDPTITEQLIINAPTNVALSMSKSYLLSGLTPGTSYTLSAGTFTGSAGLFVQWQRVRVKTA